MKRLSYDRKAFSAEPSSHLTAYGKRWEDLIDAATSATEDVDEDRTPVSSYRCGGSASLILIDATISPTSPIAVISEPKFNATIFSLPLPGLPSISTSTSSYSAIICNGSPRAIPIRGEWGKRR
jgi:hypothetical protein